ncbi:hypothetical protein AB0N09_36035 [Streptomyces erythrochromogenes]|uniref:hypothetical protein n=1 Tax=Streptomyces TaxID=1883 RepID=UPI00344064CE
MSAVGGVPPLPPGWPTARPYLVVVPEARQEQPTEDWLDRLFDDPEFGVSPRSVAYVPAPTSGVDDIPEWSAPDVDEIADRAPSDNNAVDWDRVRAAIRRARPVRTLTVIGLGTLPALVWADRVAGPVAANVSVHAAFSTAVITSVITGVGAVTGGRIRRWACAALLVAAVGGTLIAEPTRLLVASWIVGA